MRFEGTVTTTTTMNLERRMPLSEFSSSRVNKLGRFSQSPQLKRTRLPSIKTLINCSPELPTISITAAQNGHKAVERRPAGRDLDSVSEKLRVRLQLAYFKLRTNQTNTKFKDLKRQADLSISKKRRKLVVSQGNYRTPLKTNSVFNTTKSITMDSENFLHFSERSNGTAATHTTPISHSKTCALLPDKQNTPMSVKAAKSLLHLFTSSQH